MLQVVEVCPVAELYFPPFVTFNLLQFLIYNIFIYFEKTKNLNFVPTDITSVKNLEYHVSLFLPAAVFQIKIQIYILLLETKHIFLLLQT